MLEAKIKSKKGTCEVTQRLITAGNSPPTRAGRVKGKIGPAVTDPRAAGAGMFTTNWQEAGSQHPGWPCQCPAVATAKGARDTSSAQPRFLEPLLQQRHPSLWHPTSGCITAQIETQPHRQPLLLKGMDWEKKQLEWGHRGRSWWSWGRWGLNSVSASRSSNPSTPSEDWSCFAWGPCNNFFCGSCLERYCWSSSRLATGTPLYFQTHSKTSQ